MWSQAALHDVALEETSLNLSVMGCQKQRSPSGSRGENPSTRSIRVLKMIYKFLMLPADWSSQKEV